MDLTTRYLGLKLANPLMPGSSPMSDDIDTVRALVDHGAAAIVMHSIYEEQIAQGPSQRPWYEEITSHPLPRPFAHTPKEYLERIEAYKRTISVPIIASINCTRQGNWADYAASIQSAGADALELSIYQLPADPNESAAAVEKRLTEIVSSVRGKVTIPIAVKLSSFYTSLPHLARQIERIGANGMVLFNRFYQPDFEVSENKTLTQVEASPLSEPTELRLRLRWLAIMSGHTQMSLALTGGVRTGMDVMKGIMAGAHAVQIVSSLQNAGPQYMKTVLEGLVQQMKQAGATSVEQVRGCMVQGRAPGQAMLGGVGYGWRKAGN